MSIVDLNGAPVASKQSVEEQQAAAIKQFQDLMNKLDSERMPIDLNFEGKSKEEIESILFDMRRRIDLLEKVVNLTYHQPQIEYRGNNTQGRVPTITGVHVVPLLDERQLAILGDRIFNLVKHV